MESISHILGKRQFYLLALFTLGFSTTANETAALHTDILIVLATVCIGMGCMIVMQMYMDSLQVITSFHWKVKIMVETFNNALKLRYIKTCNA